MIEQIIHRLREEYALRAKQAVENVKADDPNMLYAYGNSVGFCAGLQRAETLINELLDDQEAKERES